MAAKTDGLVVKDHVYTVSQVTEIDSAGLQLLVAAKLEALIRDKQLHFVGHSKPVLEVLDLCDLGGFFGDQVVIDSQVAH